MFPDRRQSRGQADGRRERRVLDDTSPSALLSRVSRLPWEEGTVVSWQRRKRRLRRFEQADRVHGLVDRPPRPTRDLHPHVAVSSVGRLLC